MLRFAKGSARALQATTGLHEGRKLPKFRKYSQRASIGLAGRS